MSKRRVYALVSGLAAVAAVALMLAFVVLPASSGGMRGIEESSVGSPVAAPAVQETASRPGGTQEGIAVRGHWTIEVRNPDGSLVERREFDNALQDHGNEALVRLLAREQTPGVWSVILGGQPCNYDDGSPADCFIIEASSYPGSGNHLFYNLTVTPVGTGSSAKLVLSGSATPANTTDVLAVETRLRLCPPDVSPADCTAAGIGFTLGLTESYLSPTIPVVAGQIVMVTVEISFN